MNAWKNNICDKILISGGIGHSTQILRDEIRRSSEFNSIEVDGRPEADIFFDIMTKFMVLTQIKLL